MKRYRLGGAIFAIALTISDVPAQEVVEFEGPENARIYVLEGNFKQSFSLPIQGSTWYYETDTQETMDVNSGARTGVGTISASGSGVANGLPIQIAMNMSLALKAVVKQAGASIRWSGMAAMSGPMSVQQGNNSPLTAQVQGAYAYQNVTLDPATGEQTGLASYRAVATDSYGQKFPFSQPPTLTTIPRPTIYSSEGEWRQAAGDWSSEIVANVYPNGKITGTGDLIVGDPEDPYANVDQNVKGKLNSKTGVVSLSGTGATKGTSKVKVTLNYVNSTGDTVAGKSSVNAYAQNRKF